MALAGTTVLDVKSTGSDDNGGGFNPSRAGAGTNLCYPTSSPIAYTDIAAAAPPAAPSVPTASMQSASGSLAIGTYYVKAAWGGRNGTASNLSAATGALNAVTGTSRIAVTLPASGSVPNGIEGIHYFVSNDGVNYFWSFWSNAWASSPFITTMPAAPTALPAPTAPHLTCNVQSAIRPFTSADVGNLIRFPATKRCAVTHASSTTNYLVAPDSPAISFGNEDFSVAFWFRNLSEDNQHSFLTKGLGGSGAAAANFAYRFHIGSGQNFNFQVSNGVTSNLAGPFNMNTYGRWRWKLIVGVHDAVNDQIRLYIDGVMSNIASDVTYFQTAYTSGCADESNTLRLGGGDGAIYSANHSRIGFWREALTPEKIQKLYNGGNGYFYDDLPLDLKTNLTEWWDMDEAGVNKVGKVTGLTFTENNAGTTYYSQEVGPITTDPAEIVAVSGGVATLDRAVLPYGATGLSATLGGSLASPAEAVSVSIRWGTPEVRVSGTHLVKGDAWNIRGGVICANGAPRIVGYGSTYGDGIQATIRKTGTVNRTLLLNIGQVQGSGTFENLVLDGNNVSGQVGSGWNPGMTTHLINCRITKCPGGGLTYTTPYYIHIMLVGCEIDNCGTYGVLIPNSTGHFIHFFDCYFHDNTAAPINVQGTRMMIVERCIFANNSGSTVDGILTSNLVTSAFIRNCVFYNNGRYGINLSSITGAEIHNCYFERHIAAGAYAVYNPSPSVWKHVRKCAFYNNTNHFQSGQDQGLSAYVLDSQILSGSALKDAANGDFRLNDSYGATLKGAAMPTAFLGLAPAQALNIGAYQGGSNVIVIED